MGGRTNQRESEIMSQEGKDSPTLSGYIDRGRISGRASLSRHILQAADAEGLPCVSTTPGLLWHALHEEEALKPVAKALERRVDL